MATWTCLGPACGTVYAIGLIRCPRCHSTEFVETGAEMPKITKHGGPSIHSDEPNTDPTSPSDVSSGGESSSVGNSSSALSENTETNESEQNTDPLSPAPSTENPSPVDQEESSIASSADTGLTSEDEPSTSPLGSQVRSSRKRR